MESFLETLTDFFSRNWYFLIIIVFLLWLLFQRRKRATVYASKEEFDALITSGIPVIAEFYNDT